MSGPRPQPLRLKRQHQVILKQLTRRRKTPRGLSQRAEIILQADHGRNNHDIADHLKVDRTTVQRWWQRWQEHSPQLLAVLAEKVPKRVQQQMIQVILSDAPRPGTPVGFTVEQRVQIIALACENPKDSDRPVSHWNSRDLTDEIIKRDIAEHISERSVRRLLKEADLKPYRVRSWLNQIEIWFSILMRRLLKRGDFTSVDDLSEQVLAFINYFNRTLAKPFNWKYKPCCWTYDKTPLAV